MRAVKMISQTTTRLKPKGSLTPQELRQLEQRLAEDLTTLIQAFALDARIGVTSTVQYRWDLRRPQAGMLHQLATLVLPWMEDGAFSIELARLQSLAPPADKSSGAPKTTTGKSNIKSSSTPLPASKGSRSGKRTKAPTATPSGTTPRTKGGKHSTSLPYPSSAARA